MKLSVSLSVNGNTSCPWLCPKTSLGNNGRDIVSNGETLSTALVRLAGLKVGAAARVEWSGVHWVEAAWRAPRPTGSTQPLAHPRKSTTAERGELLTKVKT